MERNPRRCSLRVSQSRRSPPHTPWQRRGEAVRASRRARAIRSGQTPARPGGSLPEQTLPTRVVRVAVSGLSAEQLSGALRHHEPPVVARIVKDRVLIDPRTLLPGDEDVVVAALGEAAKRATRPEER